MHQCGTLVTEVKELCLTGISSALGLFKQLIPKEEFINKLSANQSQPIDADGSYENPLCLVCTKGDRIRYSDEYNET